MTQSTAGVSQFSVQALLDTQTISIRDVVCTGECRHKSGEECANVPHLVFPYRGAFVRHVGHSQAVGEANQVLFFNAKEGYRVSHPVGGGDASLDIAIGEPLLLELAPRALLGAGDAPAFRKQRRRIDPRAQALVALLGHSLRRGSAETLEAETLALTLVRRALGERTSQSAGASLGRQKLVDRAKIVLLGDVARRWSLAEIASEVGVSPVYLTQVFRQVEGVPLYRYQLRLRLARALSLLDQRNDDLITLGMDLGFSSHSHFSAAFRQAYGRTPAEFRRSIRRR